MATPGVTLTATLQDTSGADNPIAALRITLFYFGQDVPRIFGISVLAKIKQHIKSSTGVFSIPLWGNYQITPLPATGYAGTFYEIAVIDGKNQVVQAAI